MLSPSYRVGTAGCGGVHGAFAGAQEDSDRICGRGRGGSLAFLGLAVQFSPRNSLHRCVVSLWFGIHSKCDGKVMSGTSSTTVRCAGSVFSSSSPARGECHGS